VESPETTIDSQWAGLITVPSLGHDSSYSAGAGNCGWTASEIAKWKGSYMGSAIDPWKRSYVFDPDYFDPIDGIQKPAIISLGAASIINTATNNDIVLFLTLSN